MNSLTICGNLTRDPEVRTAQNGNLVTSFTVAVDNRDPNKKAEFFKVSVWGKTGEACAKYLSKGRRVLVSGEVRLNNWTDKSGEKHALMMVHANDVEFLDSPRRNEDGSYNSTGYTDVDVPDLPF